LQTPVHSATKSNSKSKTISKHGAGFKLIPPLLSISFISITWFYIFRFILTHQFTSESYFDDAYKDVLNYHYFTSSQLLTWAIVSVVWVSSEEGTNIPFLLYGFLGAMSASFVMWIPSRAMKKHNVPKTRTFVPFVFAITSIMAFHCICKIRPCDETAFDDGKCSKDQGFGSFQESFHFYLHGLHYVLLLPIGFTFLVPAKRQPRIDATFFHGITGLVITGWNISQLANENLQGSSLYRSLETDCQKSIHIDLLCCSILTLYAIYYDANKNRDDKISLYSLRNVSIGALLMPIISPAAVLSFHLCLENLPSTHQYMVASMQHQIAQYRRNTESETIGNTVDDKKEGREKKFERTNIETDSNGRKSKGWCNLGLWKETRNGECSYDEACENLALALAGAADLQRGDGVLSCGCGVAGRELELYYSSYNLGHITGIDPCVSINSSSFDVQNIRRIQSSVEDLISGTAKAPIFRPRLFNKILALDNIYHYSMKKDFFQYCMDTIAPGGKVAVTDIMWKNDDNTSPSPAIWVKMLLSAMGIDSSTVWTEGEYKMHLESIGFCNISVQHVSPQVFGGWTGLLPNSLIRYLEYSIIVASKREEPYDENNDCMGGIKKKKRVAIIGSGMAGLATAHAIYNSPQAKNIEVKIFEAASRSGLAGNTMKVGDQLVDVPARMAALGYYHEYLRLVKTNGIAYEVVKTDCIFHGHDGGGGYIKHIYEQSAWSNFVHAVFVGGLEHLLKLSRAFSSIPSFLADSSLKNGGLSFGDWLHDHLNIYPSSAAKSNPSKHQGWNFKHFAQHENAFLYMAIGSFGWMLSCSYRQLVACPADILLPYIDGLGLTKFLGLFNKGSVVRIDPSIKSLEHALLYGIDFECNTKICNLDEKKTINGVVYDAVVCATEASAVPYVICGCPNIFKKFHYHPSTIYLHNDPSLMPERKSDWRTWEVRMEPEQEDPQLTFWLNAYYEDINFDGDVFQTWAPIHPPRPECIIRKFEMSRVIQTSNSKDLVQLVDKEQGKGGFYYAGSYVVYGMGLLEQAAMSGKLAGERVLQDFVAN
jgi:predicted NAD/FAD-binding protein/2-polyprenyl-3-methyl-5-hydroxy-6-metoxy-1,4-benzoquinol methylase